MTSHPRFNLASDPLIKVIGTDDRLDIVSLTNILTRPDGYIGFAYDGAARAAVVRVLSHLVHTIGQLSGTDLVSAARDGFTAEQVESALSATVTARGENTTLRDTLFLDHPTHPFMQNPLVQVVASGYIKPSDWETTADIGRLGVSDKWSPAAALTFRTAGKTAKGWFGRTPFPVSDTDAKKALAGGNPGWSSEKLQTYRSWASLTPTDAFETLTLIGFYNPGSNDGLTDDALGRIVTPHTLGTAFGSHDELFWVDPESALRTVIANIDPGWAPAPTPYWIHRNPVDTAHSPVFSIASYTPIDTILRWDDEAGVATSGIIVGALPSGSQKDTAVKFAAARAAASTRPLSDVTAVVETTSKLTAANKGAKTLGLLSVADERAAVYKALPVTEAKTFNVADVEDSFWPERRSLLIDTFGEQFTPLIDAIWAEYAGGRAARTAFKSANQEIVYAQAAQDRAFLGTSVSKKALETLRPSDAERVAGLNTIPKIRGNASFAELFGWLEETLSREPSDDTSTEAAKRVHRVIAERRGVHRTDTFHVLTRRTQFSSMVTTVVEDGWTPVLSLEPGEFDPSVATSKMVAAALSKSGLKAARLQQWALPRVADVLPGAPSDSFRAACRAVASRVRVNSIGRIEQLTTHQPDTADDLDVVDVIASRWEAIVADTLVEETLNATDDELHTLRKLAQRGDIRGGFVTRSQDGKTTGRLPSDAGLAEQRDALDIILSRARGTDLARRLVVQVLVYEDLRAARSQLKDDDVPLGKVTNAVLWAAALILDKGYADIPHVTVTDLVRSRVKTQLHRTGADLADTTATLMHRLTQNGDTGELVRDLRTAQHSGKAGHPGVDYTALIWTFSRWSFDEKTQRHLIAHAYSSPAQPL